MVSLDVIKEPQDAINAARGFGPRLVRAFARNPLDSLPTETYEHFLVRGWGPAGYALHVTKPELIEEVLVRRADTFGKTEVNRRVLAPTLGEGLLVAEDAHWRWQRRASAPVFQPAKLGALAPAMLAAARETRDKWLAQPGSPLRLNHEMMRTTFAIILDTLLSAKSEVDAVRFEQAMTTALDPVGWTVLFSTLHLPEWMPHPGRRRGLAASAYLRQVTAELVANHQRDGEKQTDWLSLFRGASDPETGRALGKEQLVDNLLTFIAAGHETTAVGLAWTLQLLADHPGVETQAVEEIDRVAGSGDVKPEHLAALTYLRQLFSEAMRLYPPAPLIARTPRHATQIGGVPLKAGASVAIPIYALHRHRKLWDEPERFDPGRFSPVRSAGRHRFAYMPFGGGPHICIGSAFAMQEAVAILAVLLQRLRVRPLQGSPKPEAVMKITLRPRPELLVEAVPRDRH